MGAPTTPGPKSRLLLVYVATSVLVLAVPVAIALTAGHRTVARPVGAEFEFVVAQPGGVRLFGLRPHGSAASHRGWQGCGGSYEVEVDRSSDVLLLDLTFHPDPHLGGCSTGDHSDVQIDEGVFMPVDGPSPATVRVPDESTEHRVVDTVRGPVLAGGGTTSTSCPSREAASPIASRPRGAARPQVPPPA